MHYFYRHFFVNKIHKKLVSLFFLSTLFFLNSANANITIIVNSAKDGAPIEDGMCTLREAILAANGNISSDCGKDDENLEEAVDIVLTFPEDTIYLSHVVPNEDNAQTGDLDIHVDLNITVKADKLVAINGLYNDRIFDLHGPVTVNLSKLTIASGQPPHNNQTLYGGGIRATHTDSNLTLNDCNVTRNRLMGSGHTEVSGGGIGSQGNVTLHRSEISHNLVYSPLRYNQALGKNDSTAAMGGGVALLGDGEFADLNFLYAHDSRFVSNIVKQMGPVTGIPQDTDKLLYTRATEGGGIYAETASVNLERVEVANNLVENKHHTYGNVNGGGVSIRYLKSDLTVINSTISSNQIILHASNGRGKVNGGGVHHFYKLAVFANSTIAFNNIRVLKTEENTIWSPAAGLNLYNKQTMLINTILALNFIGESDADQREASTGIISTFKTNGHNIFGSGAWSDDPSDVNLFKKDSFSDDEAKAAYTKLALQPLTDNGGTNTLTANPRTHALGSYWDGNKLMHSIAADRGIKVKLIDVDQRGFKRPANGWSQPDIGAHEMNAKP